MNRKIKLIMKYQNTKSNDIFEEIVKELKNLINHYKYQIIKKYQEDLYQEILMNLHNVIIKFKVNQDIELDLNNHNSIEESNCLFLNDKEHYKYLKGFINKYGMESIATDGFDKFIYEYKLFCNENQFLKYLNKSFKNCLLQFYRKYKINEWENLISLNKSIYYNQELLDTISDDVCYYDFEIYLDKISAEEKSFLEEIYRKDKKVTEKDLAKKLGISQQAVSKRKIKILKKLGIFKKN